MTGPKAFETSRSSSVGVPRQGQNPSSLRGIETFLRSSQRLSRLGSKCQRLREQLALDMPSKRKIC